MTVIPFPVRPSSHPEAETPRILAGIAATLWRIGEPATENELHAEITRTDSRDAQLSLFALNSLLVSYSELGSAKLDGLSLFRRVRMNGEDAWAFTQDLRAQMRRRGLPPSLRPLSGPPASPRLDSRGD